MQIKTKTTVDFPGGAHSAEQPRAGQRYLRGLPNIVDGNSRFICGEIFFIY